MTSKTCVHCGEKKPLSEYWRKSSNSDGYDNRCKDCMRQVKQASRDEPGPRANRYVDDPCKALATAVLFHAVNEWKRKRLEEKERQRLRAFFRSDLCELWCALALVEYEPMLSALELMG